MSAPSPSQGPPRHDPSSDGRPSVRASRAMSDEEYRARAYRRGPRWALPVLATLVVCVGVAIALIYYRNFGNPPLSAQVTSFHISNRSITLTAEVTRNHPDRAVSCVLNGQGRDHGVIGSTTVTLPAGDKRVSVTRTIGTKSRPYAGQVESCHYTTG